MSERKKYYPPDFDPRKLPKLKLSRDRQFVIRIMAPMSIKCNNCGEYIYKGRKFNARQETVKNENYLGLRIYRFYIKCPRCMFEITFKTDPKNTDYVMEEGGKRCFDAAKLAAKAREKELEDTEEEEKANPMLALEKRTQDSRLEMESLEKLEELRELNKRQADVDFSLLLDQHGKDLNQDEIDLKKEEERDEKLTRETFKSRVHSKMDVAKMYDFSNTFVRPSSTVQASKAESKVDVSTTQPVVVRASKRKTPLPPTGASALVAYDESDEAPSADEDKPN